MASIVILMSKFAVSYKKMIYKIGRYIVFFLLLIMVFPSCLNSTSIAEKKTDTDEFQTVLIHCGATMVKPMQEIASIIEHQENCKVLITKGGSGNLYRSIETNKIGDLYLPGLEKYIEKAISEGYIQKKVFVGENRAVVMVKKGNPKQIPAQIQSLLDTNYRIVIGDQHSGSIGKETKIILEKKGIYEQVKKRAEYVTIDSRDLVKALINNEADIAINWFATSTWGNNRELVEVLPLTDSVFNHPRKLYIGLLTFAQNPEIAQKIIDYVNSPEGKAIFEKYGFYYSQNHQ